MKIIIVIIVAIYAAPFSMALNVEVIQSSELDVINQLVLSQDKTYQSKISPAEKAQLILIEKRAKRDQFPFESNMTPGEVTTRTFESKAPYLPNFFVIGDDQGSIAWLKRQAVFLKDNHTIGFIANVSSRARLETIEKETTWIPLLPASMDGIEPALKVEHIPFMMVSKVISQ
jgi:integrating conjugative element protein (TIGR03765 family)